MSIWGQVSCLYRCTLTKPLLLASPAGSSIQISGIAYTPEKGKVTNFVAMTVGK